MYDLYFPIWFQFLSPVLLLRVLAVNYLINGAVIVGVLHFLGVSKRPYALMAYTLWATLWGLISDWVGLIAYELWVRPLVPYSNVPINAYLIFAIAIAATLIFLGHLWLAPRLLDLNRRQTLWLAIAMGILTAPWTLFLDRSHWPRPPRTSA